MFSPLEQFDAIYLVPLYFPSSHSAILDLSFNSTILSFLLVNILSDIRHPFPFREEKLCDHQKFAH